jgi:hypothetical protein
MGVGSCAARDATPLAFHPKSTDIFHPVSPNPCDCFAGHVGSAGDAIMLRTLRTVRAVLAVLLLAPAALADRKRRRSV